MHQDGSLNGVSDLQHLVERIHQNDLVALSLKEIVDPLNVRLVLRHDLLDTRGVGDIGCLGQRNECHKQADRQNVHNAKHDGGGSERLAADASGAGDHLGFRIGNRRRHLNIDRLGGQWNTKLGLVGVDRASRECITIAQHVYLKCDHDMACRIRQGIGVKESVGQIVVIVIMDHDDLVDPQAIGAALRSVLHTQKLLLGIEDGNLGAVVHDLKS